MRPSPFAAGGPRRCAAGPGELVDGLCRVMGRALYNLTILFDLQRISLGGSVFWHHREFLLPKLRASLCARPAARP
jgi:glucokinase